MVLNAANSPAIATPTMTMKTISSTSVTPLDLSGHILHIARFRGDGDRFRAVACHRDAAGGARSAERVESEARAGDSDPGFRGVLEGLGSGRLPHIPAAASRVGVAQPDRAGGTGSDDDCN